MNDKSELLKNARKIINEKQYSVNTEKCYLDWIYRFLYFHDTINPENFSKREIQEFICFLKEERILAASTINQAINAIKFLYRHVLNMTVDENFNTYSEHSKHNPIILSREEIQNILKYLNGDKWLMTCLMYGCGISISECIQMRIKDIDFIGNKIITGEQLNSRKTILPDSLRNPLLLQIQKVGILLKEHLNSLNYEGVFLPAPIKVNNKCTSKELKWHFLFPSPKLRLLKTKGTYIQYPLSESYLQKAIKEALIKTNISKKICCHTFRHSFAVHLLEDGYDIHIIQRLLGHKHSHSTMIYKEIANADIRNIKSPLNAILIK